MNIVIVDDDQLVTLSLKTIIENEPEFHVVAIGNHGLDGISLYQKWKPDILLMDIRMDQMTGLEAAEHILKIDPSANILLLTTFSDNDYIIQALKIGVKGYLLKQEFESIVPALKAVISGQSVFGSDIVSKIPELIHTSSLEPFTSQGITDKEFEIVEKIAEGLNNKEIAEQLFLSEGTVRNYLSTILDKLDLRDRTQLANYYYKKK